MRKMLAAVLLLPALALAQTQTSFQTIGYQGRLLNSDRTPTAGPVNLTFTIYDKDGMALWQETQTNVPLTSGFYAVFLGSVTPFSNVSNLFDGSDRWLGIKVGNESELVPRQQIASVAYALTAKQLVGSATGLPTPTGNSDAANKEYVDNGPALTPISTFGSGWLAGSRAPGGRVVGGVVFLKGTLKFGGGSWADVFTLPEALRPTEPRRVFVTMVYSSKGMIMDIATNGVAFLVGWLDGSTTPFPPAPVGGAELISLETVFFVR